jgi:hypothetical protein
MCSRPSPIHALKERLDTLSDRNYLTHGIHPYPAKFIPQIPACLIEHYSREGDMVLDPFCGSGTTLLEAQIRGRWTRGVDLNPVATLIASVKTTVLANDDERKAEEFIGYLKDIMLRREQDPRWLPEGKSIEAPRFPNIDHWFAANVKRELAFLLHALSDFSTDAGSADFLKLCFSAIIVRMSNQDSETRWVARAKGLPDSSVLRAFVDKSIQNLERMRALKVIMEGRPHRAQVSTGDVREVLQDIPAASTDLIVTSPPYLNSFDYYLYHKLRMFWLGFDHRKVQAHELGSRNRHCDLNECPEVFVLAMKDVARHLHGVLRAHGACALIVGDSIYRGALLKMDGLYENIMAETGFSLEDKVSFNQRRYSRSFTPNYQTMVKESHILIFRKNYTQEHK